jgi:hypothetical protein
VQGAGHLNGRPVSITQTLVISGNGVSGSLVCPQAQVEDTATTFTATQASLTFFHAAPVDQVEVYTRQ